VFAVLLAILKLGVRIACFDARYRVNCIHLYALDFFREEKSFCRPSHECSSKWRKSPLVLRLQ